MPIKILELNENQIEMDSMGMKFMLILIIRGYLSAIHIFKRHGILNLLSLWSCQKTESITC